MNKKIAKRLTLACVAFIIAFVGGAWLPASDAHPMKHPDQELYFAHRCGYQSRSALAACVHRASIHWEQSFREMWYINWRETRHALKCVQNPTPVGPLQEHATGAMQFLPSTFNSTPYHDHNICDPKYNTLAAGWMLAHGRRGEFAP